MGQFHKCFFYKQLLHVQIPCAKKDSQVIIVFLRFEDLHAHKMLKKSTPYVNPIELRIKDCVYGNVLRSGHCKVPQLNL